MIFKDVCATWNTNYIYCSIVYALWERPTLKPEIYFPFASHGKQLYTFSNFLQPYTFTHHFTTPYHTLKIQRTTDNVTNNLH